MLGFYRPASRRAARLACGLGLSLAVGTLSGCGQKGPLYLPASSAVTPVTTPPAGSIAPSTAPSAPTP